MSNFLAIATVTKSLQLLLQKTVVKDVTGVNVTTNRPIAPTVAGVPELDVFLYQVVPNLAQRNSDLPTRRGDGSLAQKPVLALDLYYLLTFRGDESAAEPQRMMGSAMRTLHTQPILSKDIVLDGITGNPLILAGSNLADAIESVRFTPLTLTLEELSKIWSVFFQIPYSLSFAYQASVVLIESDDTPYSALPVLRRTVHAFSFRNPSIQNIVAKSGANAIVPGDIILIQGVALKGDVTTVVIAGIPVTPDNITDNEIQLTLNMAAPPLQDLRPGILPVQVVQQLNLGTPGDPHSGFESNLAAMILSPKILSMVSAAGTLTLTLTSLIGATQRAVLLLNENISVAPHAYAIPIASRGADGNTLQFPIAVAAGNYFVRVQIDGATSPLDLDPTSPTFSTPVALP